MTAEIAGIGHNNPPSDAEILQQKLITKYEKERKQTHDLAALANTMPAEIANDDEAAQITDIISNINKQDKNLEALRVAEKEPHLAAGRMVDAFFKKGQDLIGTAKKNLSSSLTVWQTKKAAEERARREAEAKAAAELAAKAAAEALEAEQAGKKAEASQILEQAVAAEQTATQAQTASQARPSSMVRTYGNAGATSSLRTVWVGELEDRATLDLNALREHLTQAAIESAIGAFVKAGGRTLKGAKIFEKSESVVR